MSKKTLCVSATETAKMLSISVSKLRQMTHDNTIPHLHIGRRILYPIGEIEDWIRQNSIVPTTKSNESGDDYGS